MKRIAFIDLGSNSVRFVIYEISKSLNKEIHKISSNELLAFFILSQFFYVPNIFSNHVSTAKINLSTSFRSASISCKDL